MSTISTRRVGVLDPSPSNISKILLKILPEVLLKILLEILSKIGYPRYRLYRIPGTPRRTPQNISKRINSDTP